MQAERVAIVGAGPAGLATARAYREHGGRGEVTLIGEEPVPPYRRPPLTKEFLRGELDAGELTIEQREWFERQRISLRLSTRVLAIDADAGTLELAGADERLRADAIVLASGSEPLRPDIPGIDDPAVLTVRRLPDSVALAERARSGGPVAVIGTGFIGCEIAGSLALAGVEVVLIGQEPRPQQERLGEGAGERIARWLAELGVELIAAAEVQAIGDGRTVELDGGRRVRAAHVALGMGARPRGALACTAGLPMHEGAVVADGAMRVRAGRAQGGPPCAVLAAGDVAHAFNAAAGRHLRVEHWGDALGQGEIAGRTLAGERAAWDSVPGFWSTIGTRTLKYAAWGDGHDDVAIEQDGDAFTAWYTRAGTLVGVLAHERDEDYERGRRLIRAGAVPA